MMFGGGAFGSVPLGSPLNDPGPITDPQAAAPFRLEINGVDWRQWFSVSSLRLTDTLGQPVSCEFVLVNPINAPLLGSKVRALYYSEVLFAGLLMRAEIQPSTELQVIRYQCQCSDWSAVLIRRKLRRNFTNLPIANIVDSILDNEVAGEGFTIGTIDQPGASIPLVDVKNARVFDVLRDVAGATGQAMYVDFNKAIQFRTSSNDTAPKVLDNTTVEASSLVEDMETYRNVQTVIVTGTPSTTNENENTVAVQRTNDDQITARQAVEGGTGRYEEIEEITHPISNLPADLALLGIGYARLRLSTSGTLRKTLKARVRGYGFRAGQFAGVNLPSVGAMGTWLIQRSSFVEQAAQHLLFELELTQSSQQQRAYEAWLSIVRAGKIVVQLPGAITSSLSSFDAPGVDQWISPITGTVEITCYGASAGGSGGFFGDAGCLPNWPGGRGGHSGKAVTVLSVTIGQVLDLLIGAAGVAGSNGSSPPCGGADTVPGTAGGMSQVSIGGVVICQGDGGGAPADPDLHYPFLAPNGSDGSGIGDAVTVGGGRIGGSGGYAPSAGQDGLVEVRW